MATLKSNLIIPEVLADYVDAKLTDKVIFAPLAVVDNSLEGKGGDTLKFPKYAYIGEADVTDENGLITPVAISADSVTKTVHKLTKAVQYTDEAKLSNNGNLVSEIGDQIVKSIADKTDDELLEEMGDAPLVYGMSSSGILSDNIVEALELFGEDADGDKAMVLSPQDLTVLRKDSDYINGSEIATRIQLEGAVGDLWGCALRPTNRLKSTTTSKNREAYIVKPGALRLINKRGVKVEVQRDALYQRDNIIASKHYVPYLYDDSKIIKIVNYLGLETVTAGITSVAGTASAGTFIKITEVAPKNFKWVYKLGTTDVTAVFGTALSGYTDWVSDTTEIDGGESTKASVALVNATDNKPVKHINLTLVKKS